MTGGAPRPSRPAVPFHKMEACGNDFVVVYASALSSPIDGPLAARLCDRHFGVGADGVLVVGIGPTVAPAHLRDQAPLSMTVWNADGSLSSMCGNGLRCVVRRALEDGHLTADRGVMASGAGLVPFSVQGNTIRTQLAAPAFGGPRTVQVGERTVHGHVVSMGNPHFVVFDDEQTSPLGDLRSWAPAVEALPAFPERTNVEHVHLSDEGATVRIWERGVGETLACGSGACAVVAAARTLGRMTAGPSRVRVPGGALSVSWDGPGTPVLLEGPARTVYSGMFSPGEELS
jgi:diaminopimelate epimerase